jgi:hypothetical protein
VLVGHVDSRAQGAGAFFGLRDLHLGASVRVLLADGSERAFKAVARRSYPKGQLPAKLNERAGRPMLILVTCGGQFDWGTHHYADNVVVFAVRVGD